MYVSEDGACTQREEKRERDAFWLQMRGEAAVIDERSRTCQTSWVQVDCFHKPICTHALTHKHTRMPLTSMSKLLLAGACVTFVGAFRMTMCMLVSGELSSTVAHPTWCCHHWWMRIACTHSNVHVHTYRRNVFLGFTLSSPICWLNRATQHTHRYTVIECDLHASKPTTFHPSLPSCCSRLITIAYCPFLPAVSASHQCVRITVLLHNNMLMDLLFTTQ